MTTPTIFSDKAANAYIAKVHRDGSSASQKVTATIPASTVSGTNVGLIRFDTGFTLTSFALKIPDLDTGSSVTFTVGYLYDGTTGESAAALLGATSAQAAGDYVWPIAGGLLTGTTFTATGPGYVSITTGGATTTTAGDFVMTASFTYDA